MKPRSASSAGVTQGERKLRKFAVAASAFFAVAGAGTALGLAMRSPLFTLRVLEVADLPEGAPVDAESITELAKVPLGEANLFSLDLAPIERRILVQPWIREVKLMKRFPQTLAVSVSFREPHALFQKPSGALSYVDTDGRLFGKVDLSRHPDLPIISGVPSTQSTQVASALRLLEAWDQSSLGRSALVSSLEWDLDHGYQAWISYPLQRSKSSLGPRGRALIELGPDPSVDAKLQFQRIDRVVRYLSQTGIEAREIWADTGKKIVVKIAHGS